MPAGICVRIQSDSMDRRRFVVASAACVSAVAGCTVPGWSRRGSGGTERNFSVQASPFIVDVRNRREKSAAVSIEISGGNHQRTRRLQVPAGQNSTLGDPFNATSGEYDVRVTAGSETATRRVDPSGRPPEKLVFTIGPETVAVRDERRPSVQLGIANSRREATDLEITVENHQSGRTYHDSVHVPAESVRSYRDVFDRNDEYRVTVVAGSKSASTTIYNSETNTLSVAVSDTELDVSVGEA